MYGRILISSREGTTFLGMAAIICERCGDSVEEMAVEGGWCFRCRSENKKYSEVRRQAVIDAYQFSRRVGAVKSGEARRFMGRFSGKFSRYR